MSSISLISANTGYNNQINTRQKPPSPEEAAKKFLEIYGTQQSSPNGQTKVVITKEKFIEALKNMPKPPSSAGQITNASNSKMEEELFAKADTNKDGVLDESELQASMQNRMQEMKASHDHNHQRPDPSKFVTAEGVSKEELIQNIKNDIQAKSQNQGFGGQNSSNDQIEEIANKIASKLFEGDTNQDGKLTSQEVEEKKMQLDNEHQSKF